MQQYVQYKAVHTKRCSGIVGPVEMQEEGESDLPVEQLCDGVLLLLLLVLLLLLLLLWAAFEGPLQQHES